MLYTIFSVIAPVFICALIGYGWVKKGLAFDTPFVSRLVMDVGAPCLIFSAFMEQEVDLAAFQQMAKATFATMLLCAIGGACVLYVAKLDQRTWLPAQMFPNVGNMGLPLCLLAFGAQGLTLGMTFFMISTMFCLTAGMMISSGQLSVRELLKSPTFYSVLITLAFLFTGLKPWPWIQNTTKLLGGFTIPLMLIAMGVSLARFHITSIRRSLSLSVLRLGMGFGVGLLVSNMLDLHGVARGITILQSTMPVAVFSYMFAVRYNRSPEEVAGTVVISTVLSFLTLPALLWFVL